MKRFDFTNEFNLRKLYNLKLIIPERSLFDLQVLLVVVAVVEEQLGKGLCLIGLDHLEEQRSLLRLLTWWPHNLEVLRAFLVDLGELSVLLQLCQPFFLSSNFLFFNQVQLVRRYFVLVLPM